MYELKQKKVKKFVISNDGYCVREYDDGSLENTSIGGVSAIGCIEISEAVHSMAEHLLFLEYTRIKQAVKFQDDKMYFEIKGELDEDGGYVYFTLRVADHADADAFWKIVYDYAADFKADVETQDDYNFGWVGSPSTMHIATIKINATNLMTIDLCNLLGDLTNTTKFWTLWEHKDIY